MKEHDRTKKAILFSGGGPIDTDRLNLLLRQNTMQFQGNKAVYIGAANGDRESSFVSMSEFLERLGVVQIDFLRLAREDVDIKASKALLQNSDIIFISGGEVEDGMNWLHHHNLADFLCRMYSEGKQFICISAGTIMMGRYWVNMDETGNGKNLKIFDCLGIIPAVFDTHAEDEDWIELKTALRLLGEDSLGYGIPSYGIITATSSGELTGYNTDILEFRYVDDRYSVTPKRGLLVIE
ncbi:MAG: Type 1 glutamine amidotransferase-like domain-containing protein [Oscillospiraceae bacterium]|nr:Type 1 glutamine amidotransferase-like domain-containing protein [Oscillospiraceae bacterium]